MADWYARARARPSFETAVARWVPDVAVEIMRANGEALWPEIEVLAAQRAGA